MKTVEGLKKIYFDILAHWKTPAKGKFVSYKEMTNLGIGGMGQQMINLLVGYMGLGAANTLIGSVIGLSPVHLQAMATIQSILSLFFTFFRSKIIDNTRSKLGRFRPYIALMGLPLVIMGGIFVFLPFERMTYFSKAIVSFCFALSFSAIAPFYSETYNNLLSVITPNAVERTKVVAVNTIFFSIAPTVTNALVPLIAGLFQGTYSNIGVYRYCVLPIAALGVGFNLFTAFGCKERVIEAPTFKPKINLLKDSKEIFKNKYWWILNVASVIGFMEGAFGVLLSWIFIYGTQDMVGYSLALTVLGTAATIGMVSAPFIIKKLGNKKTLLLHNIVNIFLIIGMMLFYKLSVIFFLFYYFNTIINSLALIYNPELYAEMKDFQQYKSRKRMDSSFNIAGFIFAPIGMATGFLIPYVYECFGLSTNYNILYDPSVRNPLFYIICTMSVIGAVLNLVPYFLFDLTSEKHKWIMDCMRFRLACSAWKKNELSDEKQHEVVEIVHQYKRVIELGSVDLAKFKREVKSKKCEHKAKVAEFKKSKKNNKKNYSIELKASLLPTMTKIERHSVIKTMRKNFKQSQKHVKNILEDTFRALVFARNLLAEAKLQNKLYQDSSIFSKELYADKKNDDRILFARIIVSLEKSDYLSMNLKNIFELANQANCKDKKKFLKMLKMCKRYYPHGWKGNLYHKVNDLNSKTELTNEQIKKRKVLLKQLRKEIYYEEKVFAFYEQCLNLVAGADSLSVYNEIEQDYNNRNVYKLIQNKASVEGAV